MNQSKAFLLLLIAITAVLTFLLVWPFIQYVLAAFLLAYLVNPLYARLEPRIGATPAALTLVVVSTVAILIPLFLMVGLIAGDAIQFVQDIDPDGSQLEPVETAIETYTGMEVDLAEMATGSVEGVVDALLGSATDIAGTVMHALIGIGLAAFLMFFLLRDGDSLARWLRSVIPLPGEVQDDLFARFDALMWAVLVGHVIVAVIQGGLAGIGLWLAGVPNALFWTLVMMLLSLIPIVGSFLVWAPAVAWLGLTGAPVVAAALFVWGFFVVGASDEFIRPLVVGRIEVNPSVIIVGVIGGMYFLGFMGLFFGPIIVGALKAVLETHDEWYDDLGDPS